MSKFLLFVLFIAAAFTVFLFFQAKTSATQTAPQLSNGELPPCPDKPNCVSSGVATSDSHYIEPLTAPDTTMQDLQQLVENDGGTVVQVSDQLLVATYKSALFGFVDDLLLLRNGDTVDVRSSSRVGYSDFDANRKRVERLRSALN